MPVCLDASLKLAWFSLLNARVNCNSEVGWRQKNLQELLLQKEAGDDKIQCGI